MSKSINKKQLYRSGNLVLGVLDDKNYYTVPMVTKGPDSENPGEEYEAPDMHFFYEMSNAVAWIADRIAKRDAVDLKSWLEAYKGEREKIEAAVA